MLLDTEITRLFDIEFPLIQAPMNWITNANLVAAVSNAGGLGVLGPNAGIGRPIKDPNLSGDLLRKQISLIRSLTKKPFGVNVSIGNGPFRAFSDKYVDVIIQEKVPIAVSVSGDPGIYTKTLIEGGVTVVHAVSSVKHAIKAEKSGADAVVAEGYGAGGHSGYNMTPTMSLVPMVVDAVKIPVIAAGGIADARGFLAAIFLGAQGAYMGTRFMASNECSVNDRVKSSIVNSKDDGIVSWRTDEGVATALRDRFTDKIYEMISDGKSSEEIHDFTFKEYSFGGTSNRRIGGLLEGDTEWGDIYCGKGAGLIKSVMPAGEIVKYIRKESEELLERITKRPL